MKYTIQQTVATDIYSTPIDTSGVFTKITDVIGEPAAPIMRAWRQKQFEPTVFVKSLSELQKILYE